HIRVNSVSPGQTPTVIRTWDGEPGGEPEDTGGSSGSRAVPLRRRGRLADYVGAVLVLRSELGDYGTGVGIAVEGGLPLRRARAPRRPRELSRTSGPLRDRHRWRTRNRRGDREPPRR